MTRSRAAHFEVAVRDGAERDVHIIRNTQAMSSRRNCASLLAIVCRELVVVEKAPPVERF